MNFALTRSRYTGNLNKLAYIGMLGDISVIIGLYAIWKFRQASKIESDKLKKEIQKENNKKLFPARTEELDYNMFSPYTPIPYHNSKITKYQHAHIDMLDYVNSNQLNIQNSYFRDFYESYDKNERKLTDWHDPYGIQKHNHHNNHGHSAHHDKGDHHDNHQNNHKNDSHNSKNHH